MSYVDRAMKFKCPTCGAEPSKPCIAQEISPSILKMTGYKPDKPGETILDDVHFSRTKRGHLIQTEDLI